MSEIGSCPVNQDKVIGKRLPVKWPRVEKNIGFQMCLRKCEAMSYCLSINFNRVFLECELNERKKNDTNDLVDDDSYFYAETVRTDHKSNVCGDTVCNNYSTCVTMAGNRKICIETECSESAPEISNGNIVQRTYSPASITYGCNKDFIGYGTTQTINCSIGGKWSPLDYRCEHKNCSQTTPVIQNGNIVQRTYSPASITYGCNKNFIGYGTTQTIYCSNGGKWSPLDYRCEHKNCSETTPVIPNGHIVQRTYSPASITYGCDPNYISHGSKQTINCTEGWGWSPLDYRCSISYTRLVGSNVPFEGRVEVFLYGSWGTVCDDYFEITDANVVCRSLGFPGALQVTHKYGSGTGDILMDDVSCVSNEATILDCGYITSHNCDHSEDVGVICKH
ncbi:soluble scavenger receptor cysteine-rich domain-containing protein SSC5D-like isoform X2 [Crassostrea angulata]|nr:soluble scavenger receptor cysteine-rich domain-containing protein SSC5D-like isoform X2 [Crassostrea angulata]